MKKFIIIAATVLATLLASNNANAQYRDKRPMDKARFEQMAKPSPISNQIAMTKEARDLAAGFAIGNAAVATGLSIAGAYLYSIDNGWNKTCPHTINENINCPGNCSDHSDNCPAHYGKMCFAGAMVTGTIAVFTGTVAIIEAVQLKKLKATSNGIALQF